MATKYRAGLFNLFGGDVPWGDCIWSAAAGSIEALRVLIRDEALPTMEAGDTLRIEEYDDAAQD